MPVEDDEWLAFARSLPRGRPRKALSKQVSSSKALPAHVTGRHTQSCCPQCLAPHPPDCGALLHTCAAPRPLQLPACFSRDLLQMKLVQELT